MNSRSSLRAKRTSSGESGGRIGRRRRTSSPAATAKTRRGDVTGSDDGPKQQVWLFDLARGGDARQVTERQEGVAEFDWSPDGDRLVIASRDPTDDQRAHLERVRDDGPIETTRLQHKVDGTGWTDDVTTYLLVADVESGDSARLDDAYGGGAFLDPTGMEPRWGPTDRIAFTSCRLERPDDTLVRDVYTIAPDGSGLRRLTGGGVAVYAAVLARRRDARFRRTRSRRLDQARRTLLRRWRGTAVVDGRPRRGCRSRGDDRLG
jgi:dipeptidyl aminopeptidase/acylaminoacyl peptidase